MFLCSFSQLRKPSQHEVDIKSPQPPSPGASCCGDSWVRDIPLLPSFLKLMIFRSPLATPILMNSFRERRMWTNDGFTLFCCISGNVCNDLSISLLACNRNSDGFLYRDKTENDGISSILWISWSICNPSFNPLCLQLKFRLLFLKTTICPGYMFQSTWKECGLNVALCSVLMNFSGYFAIFESPLFAAATLHDILEDNNLLSLMFQSIW